MTASLLHGRIGGILRDSGPPKERLVDCFTVLEICLLAESPEIRNRTETEANLNWVFGIATPALDLVHRRHGSPTRSPCRIRFNAEAFLSLCSYKGLCFFVFMLSCKSSHFRNCAADVVSRLMLPQHGTLQVHEDIDTRCER